MSIGWILRSIRLLHILDYRRKLDVGSRWSCVVDRVNKSKYYSNF